MKIGMLWYDDTKEKNRSFETKVRLAAKHYKRKYGCLPNVCYVRPTALVTNPIKRVDGIAVLGLSTVLIHHFWLGQAIKQRKKSKE